MTDNTPPTAEELRAIANRGRDAYSLATDDDWSERESSLAAYEALYAAGRVAGLEEAATIAEHVTTKRLMVIRVTRHDHRITATPSLEEVAAAIRARLGDTG